jgi:hypothetical protein
MMQSSIIEFGKMFSCYFVFAQSNQKHFLRQPSLRLPSLLEAC